MVITGKITTGLKYLPTLSEELKTININNFDINNAPSACKVIDGDYSYAISKWVSPKRTRSYPYERVYNTLASSKRITVIPVVKDEGADGDRDFLQWDTVSLMSLLDVFVIFAYYDKAEENPRLAKKITNQKFDNGYVVSKIKEIEQYHSSALHWNLKELQNISAIIEKVKVGYELIYKQTGIPMHSIIGLDKFGTKIGSNVEQFISFSREKAEAAQAREVATIQPKEKLSTSTKAPITITNYLGGQYYFTLDEVEIIDNQVYLIEAKHSKNSSLPSIGDVKDGLLKMILYSNLEDVKVDGISVLHQAILKLTSDKTPIDSELVLKLNIEAETNNFKIVL